MSTTTTAVCPLCGGPMWDERKSKYWGTGIADSGRPKPIFKCKDKSCDGAIWPLAEEDEFDQRRPAERRSALKKAKFREFALTPTPQGPTYKEVKAIMQGENGVEATRRHLMKAANLYNLCVKAVDIAIAPNVPEQLKTSEWLQAAVASLWIEASGRRSDDNVTWWSYIDKMPDKPLGHD
jgi:hypothetical protein